MVFGIGAFARLTQISVRMLRHYDDLGLLVPRVDPASAPPGQALLDEIRATVSFA